MNVVKISSKSILSLILLISLNSCFKGKHVDLIIHNATIHSLNEKNEIYDAIAISDGKIIELGAERQILNKYVGDKEIDANKRFVFPGLTDFQSNLFEGAKRKLSLDLTNSYSLDEVIVRMEKHLQINKNDFLLAFNFDTTLWQKNDRFSFDTINKHFKNTPIVIVLKNNKDVLMNKKAIESFKLESKSQPFYYNEISDKIPNYSNQKINKTLIEILHNYLQYGITDIHVLDISSTNLNLLKKVKSVINITPSIAYHSTVRKSCTYFNFNKIKSEEQKQKFIFHCEENDLQVYFNPKDSIELETAIELCEKINETKKDHRWMIAYSNEMNEGNKTRISESGTFITLLPSSSRNNKNFYPFKPVINQIGAYLVGSNFPYSKIYPHEVIFNASNPLNKNALSLNEIMKGYCYWPAFANFRENTSGTLEKGKDATLVMFEKPMSFQNEKSTNYAHLVYIKGKEVYSIE